MRHLLLAAALLSAPLSARAVDNSSRLFGMGFNTHVTPALSFKYVPAARVELVYLAGVSLAKPVGLTKTQTTVSLGNKLQYVLVAEEQMNLYAALGLIFSFGSTPFQVDYFAGPGVEFFLPGLANLGFYAEFGLGGNHRGRPFISTFADPSFGAGLHYYF